MKRCLTTSAIREMQIKPQDTFQAFDSQVYYEYKKLSAHSE